MRNEKGNPLESGLDDFFREFEDIVTNKRKEELLKTFKEDRTIHLEAHLYDRIIMYMGDKASERTGKREDAMEIAILAFLIWLKKRK